MLITPPDWWRRRLKEQIRSASNRSRQREADRKAELAAETAARAREKPLLRKASAKPNHLRSEIDAVTAPITEISHRPHVDISTDGACAPNPGRGAWAALLRFVIPSTGEIIERELTGYDPATTNNRMEMMAAICGLEALSSPSEVTLYADSQILQQGASGAWKCKANRDLWQRLDRAAAQHQISWKWVRGHAGNRDNIRVDRLAAETLARGRISGGI